MDIVEALQEDYRKFPEDQSYQLYSPDIYFKDPVFSFRGRDRYQQMIGFIKLFFLNLTLDLHQIRRQDNQIRTDWTMSWNSPLPWKPRISVDGWSELTLNEEGLIASHIDYWHCSRLDLLKQHFQPFSKEPR